MLSWTFYTSEVDILLYLWVKYLGTKGNRDKNCLDLDYFMISTPLELYSALSTTNLNSTLR